MDVISLVMYQIILKMYKKVYIQLIFRILGLHRNGYVQWKRLDGANYKKKTLGIYLNFVQIFFTDGDISV